MENIDLEPIREALAVVAAAGRETAAGRALGLMDALARLDAAARDARFDAELRHYLGKRSYTKAVMYLDGLKPPHGICGGKAR